MSRWSVSGTAQADVEVSAPNWVVALGLAVERTGTVADLRRLAVEVLPNDTVIAREVVTGVGYVIRELEPPIREVNAARYTETISDDEDDVVPMDEEETDEVLPGQVDIRELIQRAETMVMACNLALSFACEQAGAESGAVLLDERGYLRFAVVHGPNTGRLTGARLPHGTGVAGFVFDCGRPVVLDDARSDARHCGDVDAVTGDTTRSLAALPIRYRGRVHGVLEVMNLPPGRSFEPEEIGSLQRLADVLAERLAR